MEKGGKAMQRNLGEKKVNQMKATEKLDKTLITKINLLFLKQLESIYRVIFSLAVAVKYLDYLL